MQTLNLIFNMAQYLKAALYTSKFLNNNSNLQFYLIKKIK